jgi:FkbM family methyltransferase
MDIAAGFLNHYSAYGLRGVLQIVSARLLHRFPETQVRVPGIAHPIHLRVRSADTCLFRQVIRDKMYDWDFPKPPKIIVDAGAQIGLASIWFANKYPEVRIISIEPEPDNLRMLRRNTSYYPNISVFPNALWGKQATLGMDYSPNSTLSWQVRPGGKGEIQAVTMNEIIDLFNLAHIDVFKCDIEGSEKEVFETSSPWIGKIDTILIETHDRFKPGCTEAFESATRDFSSRTGKGETIYASRLTAFE